MTEAKKHLPSAFSDPSQHCASWTHHTLLLPTRTVTTEPSLATSSAKWSYVYRQGTAAVTAAFHITTKICSYPREKIPFSSHTVCFKWFRQPSTTYLESKVVLPHTSSTRRYSVYRENSAQQNKRLKMDGEHAGSSYGMTWEYLHN